MNKQRLNKQLSTFALSMFRKDFYGIYHGALSAKTESNRFVINTNEAIFDAIDDEHLLELYFDEDYRWNDASVDAGIHKGIYKKITDAKFITFSMPPFTTAYSLEHNLIDPKDYFGHQELGQITIYDPKNFDDWYDRAVTEIPKYFLNNKTNIMVIRGYGIYAYNRNLHEMAKQLAILEKSCRLLMLESRDEVAGFDY
ncbi:MAG: class II aldolase and adducin N-terminal domain-containing protein [Sulfurimonadaceae bacterium]